MNRESMEGENTEPGMELRGKRMFLLEGARGSLSQQVIKKYDLAADADPQKYWLGMEEIWEIDPIRHSEGAVMHTCNTPHDGDGPNYPNT